MEDVFASGFSFFSSFLPDPMIAHVSSFLRLNDAINFRRTCKRHASLARSAANSKMVEKHISRYLRPNTVTDLPWMKIWNDRREAMNAGLERAFAEGDLESAEFFWERGGDLSVRAYCYLLYDDHDRALLFGKGYCEITDTRHHGNFLEYLLRKKYPDSLNTIIGIAAQTNNVLLVRRCVWSGATNFNYRSRWTDPARSDAERQKQISIEKALLRLRDIASLEEDDDLSQDLLLLGFDEVMREFLPVPKIEDVKDAVRKRKRWETEEGKDL